MNSPGFHSCGRVALVLLQSAERARASGASGPVSSGVLRHGQYFSAFTNFFPSLSLQGPSGPALPLSKTVEPAVIPWEYHSEMAFSKNFSSLSVLFFCTLFRQKAKGTMNQMKGIKHQTATMKKPGRRNRIVKLVRTPSQVLWGSSLFILYCVKLQNRWRNGACLIVSD